MSELNDILGKAALKANTKLIEMTEDFRVNVYARLQLCLQYQVKKTLVEEIKDLFGAWHERHKDSSSAIFGIAQKEYNEINIYMLNIEAILFINHFKSTLPEEELVSLRTNSSLKINFSL